VEDEVGPPNRLTFVNTGKPGQYRPATNDYLHWTPAKKSRADGTSARAAQLVDGGSADLPNAADTSSADADFAKEQEALGAADEGSSLISEPYPVAGTNPQAPLEIAA
jgi:hypothetical protein